MAIIGAGPTGSLAAWEASRTKTKKDLSPSVVIFEKKKQIGHPLHCSGLVSKKGLLLLGVRAEKKKEIIQNKISRAKFISPNNISVEITRNKDSLFVLDRVAFDRYLSEEASKFGCEYHLESRVKNISFNGVNWNLEVVKGKQVLVHKCRILISAEGSYSQLPKSIGLPVPNNKWLFPAIQYEITNIYDLEPNCVELFFGRKYFPGFFGWLIPINETTARIGIGVSPDNGGKTRFLSRWFIKKHPLLQKRLSKAKVLKSYGGIVPASGPISQTFHSNFMVIGDAAGQSKATTGGGINIGGYCGRLAGMMARKIISEELPSSVGCSVYQQKWRALYEPDLSLMKLFRRLMTPLSDKTWIKVIQIARETDIEESLKTSNIDLHGIGLLKYSLSPRVLTKSLHLIPQAVTSLFHGLFMM